MIAKQINLSGGQNSSTSPLFMADSECELVQNYNLDNLGSLTKRNGIVYLIGQIVDAVNILNMFFFKDSQGTDNSNVLVACNDAASPTNSDIYKITTNAWAKSKQDDTSSSIPVFTTFIDYTFRTNGTDAMSSSADLSTWGTTNCLATLLPKYVCVWEDRVYALNDNSSTKYPSRIYWSSLPANIDQINGAVSIGATTITIDSTTGFLSASPTNIGYLVIGGDTISYTGISSNDFTGVSGVINAIPDNTKVYQFNGNATLEIDWTSSVNYADINPDDNDVITWGEPFGKVLLIFKEEGLYRWTFGQVEPDKIPGTQGTPQGLTVKQTQGICFWANKYGVWALTNPYGTPQLISKKLQPFIDAIPTLTNMRAEVDDDHYYLFVGDITIGNDTYSNCMLIYTISKKTWHIETYPFIIKAIARFKRKTLSTTTEIYDDIYIGDNDGFVYRKGNGTTDYLGTATRTISGKILTKEYPLANFPKDSQLDYLWILAQKASGAKVNYRIDRRDWKPWKDLSERFTEGKIAGKGKTIQFSITDNSSTISQIEGFLIETTEKTK